MVLTQGYTHREAMALLRRQGRQLNLSFAHRARAPPQSVASSCSSPTPSPQVITSTSPLYLSNTFVVLQIDPPTQPTPNQSTPPSSPFTSHHSSPEPKHKKPYKPHQLPKPQSTQIHEYYSSPPPQPDAAKIITFGPSQIDIHATDINSDSLPDLTLPITLSSPVYSSDFPGFSSSSIDLVLNNDPVSPTDPHPHTCGSHSCLVIVTAP